VRAHRVDHRLRVNRVKQTPPHQPAAELTFTSAGFDRNDIVHDTILPGIDVVAISVRSFETSGR
jgi:hypothetical protein